MFEREEPGTIALLVLFLVFLALSPRDACSFHPERPAASAQTH